MAKMSYQQARAIRNMPKLSELIRQNAVNGMGAGQSIKQAVKEKLNVSKRLKAKVVGIKEKFDPMNIAKFMTGGSRTAAALVGRWTGRSQEDIENFAGGTKKPVRNRGTADKLGPLAQGGQSSLSGPLNKIYSLLSKSNEDSIRRREMDANREEERQIEDDRRHKELMDALGGAGGAPTATPVEPKKETGFLGKMLALIEGMKLWVLSLLENLDIMKYLNKLSWFKTLFSFMSSNLFRLVFMNPALLGIASVAALTAYLFKAGMRDENGNRTVADDAIDAVAGATADKLPTPVAEMEKFDRIMSEGGTKTSNEAYRKKWIERKEQGVAILPEEAQAVKLKYGIDWPDSQITASVQVNGGDSASPSTVPGEIESSQATPAGKEVKGYLRRKPAVPGKKVGSSAEEMRPADSKTAPTTNADGTTQKFNRITKEHTDIKLDRINKSTTDSNINNTTNVSSQSNPAIPKGIPSVRNTESTYASIIFDNIRVT